MKLQTIPLGLEFRSDVDSMSQTLSLAQVRAMLSAIDTGHLEALRYYVIHGKLPPEAPVWPTMTVIVEGLDRWVVMRSNGFKAASVSRLGDEWKCVDSDGNMSSGPTPQAAVDSARAWLAERWGLSVFLPSA